MRTWRTIEVYKNKNLSGVSGTNTFALPRTHMIGDLWLVVRGQNLATGNICDSLPYEGLDDAISKITVRSGSKTFKSYSGYMNRSIAAHMDGQLAPATKVQGDSLYQEMMFPIHFGIEPQDEDVILPAPLLDSLDLVLDYSFSASNAGRGFQSGSLYFDLYASVLEPTADLEDKMILVQEKKQDVTYDGGGVTPFDLTLDERRLLRKVYVEAFETTSVEGATVEDIEVKADNEQVMKMDWEQMQFQNAIDHNLRYRDHIRTWESDGNGDIYHSRIPDVEATLTNDAAAFGGMIVLADIINIDSTLSNEDVCELHMWSDVNPCVAVVDFDRDNSMRRLQPQGIRDLDIILNDGGSAGAGEILEESLQKIW